MCDVIACIKYWILISLVTAAVKIYSLDVHPPLSADDLRILKILLSEHLEKLTENGVNFDLALSGELVLTQERVVECLHHIGQVGLSKILNNKQGNKNLMILD